MKPDWDDVSNGYNWLAMDRDGEWWSFTTKPLIDRVKGEWDNHEYQDAQCVTRASPDPFEQAIATQTWMDTLEERP